MPNKWRINFNVFRIFGGIHRLTIHPDINDPPSIPGIYWFGIFSFVCLYTNYSMTWHFDKALKKEVIDLTERIILGHLLNPNVSRHDLPWRHSLLYFKTL